MVLKVARMGGADWLARACAPRMRRSNRVDVSNRPL
jgi:hypothetical protein